MDQLIGSNKKGKIKAKYYNSQEDSYYCRSGAYSLFSQNEGSKIGSVSLIKEMIMLCQKLLFRIKGYVNEEQMAIKWQKALEMLKIYEIELGDINIELENTLKSEQFKELLRIEQRSLNLKFQITESEAYRKYLFYKDINEIRFNNEKEKEKEDQEMIKTIDLKNVQMKDVDEKSNNLSHLNIYENAMDNKKEEIKMVNIEETEKIKLFAHKELYNGDNEQSLSHTGVTVQKLSNLKAIENDKLDENEHLPNISYSEFNALYKNFIGESKALNSSSNISFDFLDQKWINLLNACSKSKLPELDYYYLNYVPADSEEVRSFMKNSIPIQNQFFFNASCQEQVEGSKYIEEIKTVAKKTLEYFFVGCTKLSSGQFFDIISSAKNGKEVCFRDVPVTFDEDQDFVEMSGCKICTLSFTHITFPNSKLNGFENIIAAISRCSELSNSLKTIYISWVISKSEAQEILKKYSLNEIQIIE